jgi:hypothetical protein
MCSHQTANAPVGVRNLTGQPSLDPELSPGRPAAPPNHPISWPTELATVLGVKAIADVSAYNGEYVLEQLARYQLSLLVRGDASLSFGTELSAEAYEVVQGGRDTTNHDLAVLEAKIPGSFPRVEQALVALKLPTRLTEIHGLETVRQVNWVAARVYSAFEGKSESDADAVSSILPLFEVPNDRDYVEGGAERILPKPEPETMIKIEQKVRQVTATMIVVRLGIPNIGTDEELENVLKRLPMPERAPLVAQEIELLKELFGEDRVAE